MQAEFKLGEIANDFRDVFLRALSNKAEENSWKAINVAFSTNEEQDALYFEQTIYLDTGRVIEGVYRDIQNILKSLRARGWEFQTKCIKKACKYKFENITLT